jgi:Ca2+-transporting ATPase
MMPEPPIHIEHRGGLSDAEIPALQARFGKNVFRLKEAGTFLHTLLDIIREPMFILLVIVSILYFVLGDTSEGFMMLVAIVLVSAISFYEVSRSTKALKALEKFTEPRVTVVRSGKEKLIPIAELVPGDLMLLTEGHKISADAVVVAPNDFTVDESLITGESLPVTKSTDTGNDLLYQGSIVNSGKAYARVTATGNQTVLGKIGKTVSTYTAPKTLLQKQIRVSVLRLTYFGISAFLLIWILNYMRTGMLVESLLLGLTLAMAAIPEEIPVAFSSFMALGAYHMSKLGIISRQPQTIENLGAISVICLDKTGTITENKMELKSIYDFDGDVLTGSFQPGNFQKDHVLYYAMLASETDPFDSMEKAIHEAYKMSANRQHESLKFIHEYPLHGRPPMMTHVYQSGNVQVVAAKGAAEKIMEVCPLDPASVKKISGHIQSFASKGYRVLGVASALHSGAEMPASQEGFSWKFEGLLALYDPPRKNIDSVFKKIYGAGIDIRILSGDFPETVMNIAAQVGTRNCGTFITGEQVMQMTKQALQAKIKTVNIFARMFPEAKLKVVEALKAEGEIVAMTGDGVNDGPALKSSDIGIAMGEKGTEIAKRAADLILTDDDLGKLTEAIRQGRKIFSNLKKAVRYIISIHIPIILTASVPVMLGWKYPNIFTPVHVIFLELIMGPTCSIFFEREPVEENIMEQPPRNRKQGMFSGGELLISIVQGIVIAGGVLILYYGFMNSGRSLNETRTAVFTTLVLSNILLTFANRSFTENFIRTLRYKNNLAPWILIISLLLIVITQLIPSIREIFRFSILRAEDIFLCSGIAMASVIWFEGYKTHFTNTK